LYKGRGGGGGERRGSKEARVQEALKGGEQNLKKISREPRNNLPEKKKRGEL